jgi:endonuclease VIII-like 1
MPELAELRLTADFINQQAEGKVFHYVKKNPIHKCMDPEPEINFPFTIKAKSRGKELMLELTTAPDFATEDNIQVKHLMMTMGMSGHFEWIRLGIYSKHSHLSFRTEDGSLDFVDVRRFGKWNFGYWNSDRGPDPTQDYTNFVKKVNNNLDSKAFQKPICEVLMNQKYFNGIGNYLRAEILYRANVNPWMPAKDAIIEAPEILELCKALPLEAYKLGGGQLKDWENPFGEKNQSWDDFMQCYGNPRMQKREWKGRTMWYHPKWDKLTAWCEYSDMPSPMAYESI